MEKKFTIKNWIGLALVIFALVGGFHNLKIKNKEKENSKEMSELTNSFIEFDNIEKAQGTADFKIELINIEGLTQVIRVIPKKLIEVIYQDKTGKETFKVRKAPKTEIDISEDYNQYKDIEKVMFENIEVETRGNNGNIYTATWSDGNYNFVILSKNNAFSQQEIIDFVKTIK